MARYRLLNNRVFADKLSVWGQKTAWEKFSFEALPKRVKCRPDFCSVCLLKFLYG